MIHVETIAMVTKNSLYKIVTERKNILNKNSKFQKNQNLIFLT